MKQVSLTDEQLSILHILLKRVQLQGVEVPAFVSIVQSLNDAQEV
jgi:hypothetical protein